MKLAVTSGSPSPNRAQVGWANLQGASAHLIGAGFAIRRGTQELAPRATAAFHGAAFPSNKLNARFVPNGADLRLEIELGA